MATVGKLPIRGFLAGAIKYVVLRGFDIGEASAPASTNYRIGRAVNITRHTGQAVAITRHTGRAVAVTRFTGRAVN